jgi:hypothetical protein
LYLASTFPVETAVVVYYGILIYAFLFREQVAGFARPYFSEKIANAWARAFGFSTKVSKRVWIALFAGLGIGVLLTLAVGVPKTVLTPDNFWVFVEFTAFTALIGPIAESVFFLGGLVGLIFFKIPEVYERVSNKKLRADLIKSPAVLVVIGIVQALVFVSGHDNATMSDIILRFYGGLFFYAIYVASDQNLFPAMAAHGASNLLLSVLKVFI